VEEEDAGGEGGGGGGGGDDLAEFAGRDSEEAAATLARAAKARQFASLFRGLVFFLGREVPRDLFEFLAVCFRGRVGWEGPGSPYAPDDARITHHVWDRPGAPRARVEGREYVQPQWVADSINARLLLPVGKYAPGAALPPHLSPFVDDAAEGYIPAYRMELDAMRAAAAVTGRLADVISAGAEAAAKAARKSRVGTDAQGGESEEVEGGEELDGGEEGDEGGGEEEGRGEGGEEEEEEDAEDVLQRASATLAAGKKRSREAPAVKAGALPAAQLLKEEEERRAMAAVMMSRNQRKLYEKAMGEKKAAQGAVQALVSKREKAAAAGDVGVGAAAVARAAAAAAAAQPPAPGAQAGKAAAKKPRK
jgi:pescadillo protein